MKISVVCPFYNEELILNKALEGMLNQLAQLPYDWELVIVNDGSKDKSLKIAESWQKKNPKVMIVTYSINQGRGYALKSGIDAANGDIIVTTEIDLSWGSDIVERLAAELIHNEKLSFVIASPNLLGGGYKNVPLKRVAISKLGNKLLSLLFSGRFTMNTGMTRAYRRNIIQPLTFREKGKEFHLEVLLKLSALGFFSTEIPATLEWKDHKLSSNKQKKRKSSSKIPQLIATHLRFAIMANPIRYFWGIAILNFFFGFGFTVRGICSFLSGNVAIYFLLIGFLFFIFSLFFFGFGIVTAQNRYIMEEIWLSNLKHRQK